MTKTRTKTEMGTKTMAKKMTMTNAEINAYTMITTKTKDQRPKSKDQRPKTKDQRLKTKDQIQTQHRDNENTETKKTQR